jgi:hypothetical protein
LVVVVGEGEMVVGELESINGSLMMLPFMRLVHWPTWLPQHPTKSLLRSEVRSHRRHDSQLFLLALTLTHMLTAKTCDNHSSIAMASL